MSGPGLTIRCPGCAADVPYDSGSAGRVVRCALCGGDVLIPKRSQGIALRVRRRRTSPMGLCLEVGGFLLLMWFPIGTVVGFVLLVIGHRQSRALVCGQCESDLPNADAARCPHCKSALADE